MYMCIIERMNEGMSVCASVCMPTCVHTYWGLDHHGPLVPHGPHDVQRVDRLTVLHQTQRCLHGYQHPRATYPSTEREEGERDRGRDQDVKREKEIGEGEIRQIGETF